MAAGRSAWLAAAVIVTVVGVGCAAALHRAGQVALGILACALTAAADDIDQLKVGRQPDGRIITPTNQVLRPAGKVITFPGRPVDLKELKAQWIAALREPMIMDTAKARRGLGWRPARDALETLRETIRAARLGCFVR